MSRTFRTPEVHNDDVTYHAYQDGKRFSNPPKWFKKMLKRKEKAKEKDALRHMDEVPKFKKHYTWDWN